MVASGEPTIRSGKRSVAQIVEWRSDDDAVLLVAEEGVRWGALNPR